MPKELLGGADFTPKKNSDNVLQFPLERQTSSITESWDDETKTFSIEKTEPLSRALKDVSIVLTAGNITMTGGTDKNSHLVTRVSVSADTEQAARDRLGKNKGFSMSYESGKLSMAASEDDTTKESESETRSIQVSGVRREIELTVPKDTEGKYTITTVGDITMHGITGISLSEATDGKVKIDACEGLTYVRVEKGEASIKDSKGILHIGAYNSNVAVDNFKGSTQITGSGITSTVLRDVTFVKGLNYVATDGEIDISVRNDDLHVSFQGSKSIDVSDDFTVYERPHLGQREGFLGSNPGTENHVTLRTGNGDIVVKKSKQ